MTIASLPSLGTRQSSQPCLPTPKLYRSFLPIILFIAAMFCGSQASAQGVSYSQAFVGTAVKTQVATISSVVSGLPVYLRIKNPALLNNPNIGDPDYVQVDHTVGGGENANQVATALTTAINTSTRLSSIGVSAASSGTTSVTLTSLSSQYTTFSTPPAPADTTGATVTFSAYSEPLPGTLRVGAAGSGIAGSADSIGYVYTTSSGNSELISQVTWNVAPSSSYGIAGLAFRESLDAGAQEASVTVSQGNGVNFTVRTATGATIQTTLGPALTAPIYLRLVRSGNTIGGYQSSDRINWQLVGTYTFTSLPTSYLAGFAVSSTAATTALADFSQVSYLVSVPQRSSKMLLWLRPDVGITTTGTAVNVWSDQSGLGNDGVQGTAINKPTLVTNALNGLPVLSFDGNDWLQMRAGFNDFSAGASIFIVTQPNTQGAGNYRFLFLGKTGTVNDMLSTDQTSSTGWRQYVYNGATGGSVSANDLSTSSYQLIESVYNGTNTLTLYRNGVQSAQSTGMPTAQVTSRTSNTVGAYSNGSSLYFSGKIAEILVFNKSMTTSERQEVETYLYSKFAVGTPAVLSSPSITPNNAIVTEPTRVTITADANAAVYYTLDGTLPVPGNSNTFQYVDSFMVSQTTTVNAIAVAPYYTTGASSSVIQFVPTANGLPKDGMLLWFRSDIGVTLNGSQKATVGTPLVSGQPAKIRIYNVALNSSGFIDATYNVGGGDTTTTVATGLKNAINADTTLQAKGITATSSAADVTISSTSSVYTTYGSVGSTGATITITTYVKQWADLSGAGRNATNTSGFPTPTAPTLASSAINGLPALSFVSASSQYLQLPTSGFADLTKGLTYVAVVKPTTVAGNIVSLGNGASANAVQMNFVGPNAVGLDLFTGTTETSVYSTSGATAGSTQIFEAVHNGGGNASIFTNGTQGAQAAIGNLLNATRGFNYIGRYSGGTAYLNGQIAELLAYDHPLSPGERIALENYLSNRYFNSLIVSPPTGVYGGTQTVAMAAGAADTIWYTLDGSTPTTSAPSLQYSAPFPVADSTLVKAIKASAPGSVVSSYIAIDPMSTGVPRDGLTLWLRPGFGGYSATTGKWIDLSGAKNDASGSGTSISTKTLNGYPLVTGGYLTFPTGMNSFNGAGVFVVGRPDSQVGSADRVWLDFGNGSASNNIRVYTTASGGTTSGFSIYNAGSSSSVTAASSVTEGQYYLLAGVQNGSTSGSLYVNGLLKTTGTLNKPNNVDRTASRLRTIAGSSTPSFVGDMAEILVYNKTVSSKELADIHAYLLRKFQIATSAPSLPIFGVPSGTLAGPMQVPIYASPDNTILWGPINAPAVLPPYAYSAPLYIYYTPTQVLYASVEKNGINTITGSQSYTLDSSAWPPPSGSTPTITPQLPTNLAP